MTFGDLHRLADVGAGKDDREFLAPVSAGDILGPAPAECCSSPLENLVPERVAVRVVEGLESIEVGEDQGDLGSMSKSS